MLWGASLEKTKKIKNKNKNKNKKVMRVRTVVLFLLLDELLSFSLSPLSIMLVVGFLYMTCILLMYVPFISTLLRVFFFFFFFFFFIFIFFFFIFFFFFFFFFFFWLMLVQQFLSSLYWLWYNFSPE